MSTLLGGGTKNKTPVYTGIDVQTSSYNLPIPLGWGKNRRSFNLIWYNNFQKHKQSSGKGGGKGGQYTYTAAVILSLGEGIITSVPTVYLNQNTITTLANRGLSLMTGTATQSPESFISTKYPAEALAYSNTAYLFAENLDLGSSATIPSMSFECVDHLSGTMPGTPDVNIADVIVDYLTSTQYGNGFLTSVNDATSLAYFKSYTQAQGLFFSPVLTRQEKIVDTLNRWAKLANSWIFWSGNVIKYVPLGDQPLSANSATYTPNSTIEYDLTADDFIDDGNGLIKVNRIDPADAYNRTIVTIKDRALHYNSNPIEYKDSRLIGLYGLIDNVNIQGDDICDANVGKIAATLIGKRAANLRNTYEVTLTYNFVLLEPGDLCTLTHPFIAAINKLPVRVVSVDENSNGDLKFLFEEYPGILGNFYTSGQETNSSTPVDQLVSPGNVNDPCIFEPRSDLASPAQVWISASGGVNWGGADVYVGFGATPATYTKIGTISNAASQGVLTATLASHADPDTTNTLSVDMTESQTSLASVTHADADAFRTLSYISAPSSGGVIANTGELIAYGTVTPTGTFTDNLTYLRRGLYGTTPASHASGQNFTVLDLTNDAGQLLKYAIPAPYIGQAIHVKFVSFNLFGFAYQDISTVTDYVYTTTGAGFGGGTGGGGGTQGGPTTPTGLAVSAIVGANVLTWNPNPTTDNVTSYAIFRANGAGAVFGSATQIGSAGAGATSYHDTTATLGASYTYFLEAGNIVGFSAPTSGASITSSAVLQGSLRVAGGTPGRAPLSSEELLNPPMATGDILPHSGSSFTKAFLQCEVAPAANWTITFKKNGTTVATGTILAGNTTGTFSGVSADVVFADADSFTGVCQSTVDASIKGVAYAIFGTRTQ